MNGEEDIRVVCAVDSIDELSNDGRYSSSGNSLQGCQEEHYLGGRMVRVAMRYEEGSDWRV